MIHDLIHDRRSSVVKSVFDCRRSGVWERDLELGENCIQNFHLKRYMYIIVFSHKFRFVMTYERSHKMLFAAINPIKYTFPPPPPPPPKKKFEFSFHYSNTILMHFCTCHRKNHCFVSNQSVAACQRLKDKLSQTNTRICSRWNAIANPHAKILDPQPPPSHIPEHDPGDRMKILFDMFYISYLWEHTPKFGIKIFEIDFVIEILWYLTFWLHRKVTSSLGWKFYLYSVLLIILPHDNVRKN